MIKLVHHEMVINSKFLEVPRSYYQRTLNANRVKRIAAEFDERIANAPKVSYRDGHYYVFDGQHTIAARKLLNNNCDLNIVCKVYSGLTEQQEAMLFAQQTGISHRLQPVQSCVPRSTAATRKPSHSRVLPSAPVLV